MIRGSSFLSCHVEIRHWAAAQTPVIIAFPKSALISFIKILSQMGLARGHERR